MCSSDSRREKNREVAGLFTSECSEQCRKLGMEGLERADTPSMVDAFPRT